MFVDPQDVVYDADGVPVGLTAADDWSNGEPMADANGSDDPEADGIVPPL